MINWGILGLGRMGLEFANAIEETSNAKLNSVSSKSGKIYKNYNNETYEDLIHNKDIDAIYMHRPFSFLKQHPSLSLPLIC